MASTQIGVENLAVGSGVAPEIWRNGLLRRFMASAFILFFQAYMIAPLIPHLAEEFRASRQTIGLMVPAYLLPYAVATLAYGLLIERFGRRIILFVCYPLFFLFCGLTALSQSVDGLIIWRVLTGLAGGGVAVVALTLIGDLFPVEQRGRAFGGLFGAIAGGIAFGSTLGGILTPMVGWRNLFLIVASASALLFLSFLPYWKHLAPPRRERLESLGEMLGGYAELLVSERGRKTFGYILLNGIFHSGVFTWLGVYLFDRYHLGEAGIGVALLGYGIPGFFLGPVIGGIVDKHGRGRMIPWGLAVAALAGAALILKLPLLVATAAITLLSLGFDMTHPLLAGIVSTLSSNRRGQAMGLNTFTLFLGSGLGSVLFGWAMQRTNFSVAVGLFAAVQIGLALAAIRLFKSEHPAAA